ncbi:hypothetical protein ACWCQP_49485 [Streptomyces chartreusis]
MTEAPDSIEAEQIVLGAVMVEKGVLFEIEEGHRTRPGGVRPPSPQDDLARDPEALGRLTRRFRQVSSARESGSGPAEVHEPLESGHQGQAAKSSA